MAWNLLPLKAFSLNAIKEHFSLEWNISGYFSCVRTADVLSAYAHFNVYILETTSHFDTSIQHDHLPKTRACKNLFQTLCGRIAFGIVESLLEHLENTFKTIRSFPTLLQFYYAALMLLRIDTLPTHPPHCPSSGSHIWACCFCLWMGSSAFAIFWVVRKLQGPVMTYKSS